MQKAIDKKEVKKTIDKLKLGKAGVDGITRNVRIWKRNSGGINVSDM